jgi:hypothetical protein
MSPSVSWGVLSERRFRMLFCARTVSSFGNQMAPIALAFAVLDLTGSATDVGATHSPRLPNVREYTTTWANLLPSGMSTSRIPAPEARS